MINWAMSTNQGGCRGFPTSNLAICRRVLDISLRIAMLSVGNHSVFLSSNAIEPIYLHTQKLQLPIMKRRVASGNAP